MAREDMQYLVERWVRYAKEAHRTARAYSKCSRYLQGNEQGKAFTYLLCARTIKGYETEARTVNARRRMAA